MPTAQVLIVEDKQPLADMYAEWVGESYAVEVAYTGREALDALDHDIDVVLLDRRLPDIPGDEILSEIGERGIDCSVAMVTAVSPDFDVVSLGFDDYLTKPVSIEELRETVADLARRTKAQDVLRESFAVRSKQSTLVESVLQDDSANAAEGHERPPWQEDLSADRDIDMSAVDAHVLPTVVSDLADEYEEKLGYRDRFLLKWLHVVFPFFTLTSVPEENADQCQADKTLASMFVMLLDDIGERHHDKATLAEVAKLPFPQESVDRSGAGLDTGYLDVTESVWDAFDSRLSDAPRYDEIEPIL
jgi:CheY-like chemotaxis protein